MKVLIDTNVLLDVLCARPAFCQDAAKVWKLCETGEITGVISALSVPNIVYIMRKELDAHKVREVLQALSLIFSISDLTESDLKKAADLEYRDYEDALQSVCAWRIHADYIITRNEKDFAASSIPAVSPSAFLALQ